MRGNAAFSLLEVLLVLVILGILGSMAYPNYAGYQLRTRRVEGQMALLHRMQDEERYFNEHQRYRAFGADAGGEADGLHWWSGSDARHSAYELRGRACPGALIADCVLIEALPGTERVDVTFRDPECGALSLDSAGVRAAGGPAGRCWP